MSQGRVENVAVAAAPAGDVRAPTVWLTLFGLLLTGTLLVRRVPGALLLGILGATGAAWLGGLAEVPSAFVSAPALPRETLFAMDFSSLFTGKLITVVLAFLFVDFFDTAGTLMGVGRLGGPGLRQGGGPARW